MACPLARARAVLHAIDAVHGLMLWNPPLAVRLSRAGFHADEAIRHGEALLANGGGAPGGKPRDKSKAKRSKAARRRNRRK